jgi:hypothetical protein
VPEIEEISHQPSQNQPFLRFLANFKQNTGQHNGETI